MFIPALLAAGHASNSTSTGRKKWSTKFTSHPRGKYPPQTPRTRSDHASHTDTSACIRPGRTEASFAHVRERGCLNFCVQGAQRRVAGAPGTRSVSGSIANYSRGMPAGSAPGGAVSSSACSNLRPRSMRCSDGPSPLPVRCDAVVREPHGSRAAVQRTAAIAERRCLPGPGRAGCQRMPHARQCLHLCVMDRPLRVGAPRVERRRRGARRVAHLILMCPCIATMKVQNWV